MFLLPPGIEHLISAHPGSILLETSRFDPENRFSYLFLDPDRVLIPPALDAIPTLFQDIEALLDQGYFVAGAMSYECGYHFEPSAAAKPPILPDPLAWFGAYKQPWIFDHETGAFNRPLPADLPSATEPAPDLTCRVDIAENAYSDRIARIRDYIAAGDTYQVNFTTKVLVDYPGEPVALYRSLRRKQTVPFAALLNLGRRHVLSFSPELFFRLSGRNIVTRPMKGTAARGVNRDDDRRIENWLRDDPKNRSENVMIVDLLRSDLGRVAEPGSVRVERLFDIQQYETLFQMTSTVRARLRDGVSFYDLFRAIFPCGSVTGAPKPRTMQIIQELEGASRGIYTGAIGFFSPARDAAFSVPIRTIVLEEEHGQMGVGSGIVYDAIAAEEYEECRLKMEFLTRRNPPFQLLETLRWEGEYWFFREHLDRLAASAEYFGFRCRELEVADALMRHSSGLTAGVPHRVRLLLRRRGDVSITSQPLHADREEGTVTLASARTSSTDRFLYHKTTHRELYDREYQDALRAGHLDALFANERGEITEGAIHNVFLRQGSQLCTPPLSSGLLPGVYRRHVLATDPSACEKVLRIRDLLKADAIYICNSVRGIRRVRLSLPAGM